MHEHASLNRAYRVVFNEALGAMVAVPETARGHGASASCVVASAAFPRRRLALALALALAGPGAWALDPNTLPKGGQPVAGQATSIDVNGSTMTVNQGDNQRAIVNWQSFDVGTAAGVRFVQPSASAAILNRVQSGPGSQILGSIDATGQVYLVNPAGVLFGSKAQVNVGGITASTLGITDSDFLAGRDRFTTNGSAGAVVNQGTIRVAPGGRVALIGTRVENAGQILAPGGQVVLAAGQQATIAIGANGRLQVAVDAEQVETLVANGGLVQADGGQVILTAKGAGALASSVVSNTGTLQARTVDGSSGRILLLADMAHGKVEAGGTLDASAPQGGNGGFIETSAAHVKIAPDLQVTTAAAHGSTGKWLIDPQDYTIAAAGGDITGTQLSTLLGGTDIEIQSISGAAAGNGDIHVNDAVSWSANTLTLTAQRDININAVMTASGSSALEMNTGTTVPGGAVKVGMKDGGFIGRVDFPNRSGTGFLTINGAGYTVINALGTAGSMTGTDLQGMNGDLARNYALGGDIDASATSTWNSGQGFAPVGPGTTYTGNFEGLGHTVRSVTINRPGQDAVGLFGWTSGRVSNVGQVGGSVSGQHQTGGLVGRNFGEIANSYVTGTVQGAYEAGDVGGLVGRNDGWVRGSHSSAAVSGQLLDPAGGLVGRNLGGIVDSYATGAVTVTGPYAWNIGGLAGRSTGSITRSYATGAVTGNSDVGGLVGYEEGGASITDSFATGSVNAAGAGAGGLVGRADGSISRSHATGQVQGYSHAGGLVGLSYWVGGSNSIEDSYATGSVTATQAYAGGLVGASDAPVFRSYATGAVTAQVRAGGLAGSNTRTISTSYSTGAVSAAAEAGGLVGLSDGGAAVVTDSYWNVQTSGQAGSAGGTGLTSAQMELASNFAGFNFTTTPGAAGNNWVMVDVDGTLNNAGGAAGATRPMLASEYSTTIRNAHQLQLMAMDLGADYQLKGAVNAAATGNTTDVWSGSGFVPVGNNATPFTGTLDGGSRTITGLTVNPGPGANDRVGLFGVIGAAGSVHHVGLANATVSGDSSVGALAGQNFGLIDSTYADATVTGQDHVGGLVGRNDGTLVSSYTKGSVMGTGSGVGGLVGTNDGIISHAYASSVVGGTGSSLGGLVGDGGGSVISSLWNFETSGQFNSAGGIGAWNSEMVQFYVFASNGWDISATGGSSRTWRIYDGQTEPLLRSFLTPLTPVTNFDGSGAPLADAGGHSVPVGTDMSKIFGTATPAPVLTLSSTGSPNNYLASAPANGLFSNQSGYDIAPVATRVISTPGSAVGDVRLDNPVTWTSGTIQFSAAGNVDLNNQALSGAGGALSLNAGNQIQNAGNVAVNLFDLQAGTWDQVAGTLPSFSAADFRISGGTFIRATGGDGTAPAPYQLTDVYGLQGAGSSGMADKSYVLVDDIAAAGTANWNAGAGFAPITLDSLGSFDGQGHTITGLVINRPGEDNVGLFDSNAGSVANLGLVGGSVAGRNQVGGLAGVNSGSINNVSSTASVSGANTVGGLVGSNSGGSGSNPGGIENSNAGGSVNAPIMAGGLVGYNSGDIVLSYATGGVTGTSLAGGLVGWNDAAGVILGSNATGTVNATSNGVGGLVGRNDGEITSTFATGAVTGREDVGGLVGQALNGSIVGGHASGTVNGFAQVGGLAGRNNASISGSNATGTVRATVEYAGGLVGQNNGSITTSFATGNAQAVFAVGGLVGFNFGGTISRSYATGSANGSANVGGLVGRHGGSITDSYATGAASGGTQVGGLVGYAAGSVTNAYSSGAVSGSSSVGGLVGELQGAGAIVTGSYWNSDTAGPGATPDGRERTTAQMQAMATFGGWDVSATGGTGNVWRIYEGQTAPLLRNFLVPLAVTPDYDGSGTPLANAASYTVPGWVNTSRIFGTGQLVLSSSGASDNYLAGITGLYSNQAGYDLLPTGRTIATPGTVIGELRLDNPITWTNGTVNITSAGNIDLNGQALSSPNGTLNFNAVTLIQNAGSVAVNLFDLQGGIWDQVPGTLPSFSASDFRISGGTFIRAQGGDGSQASPYQLADIYGVQGADSAGMADKNYVLVNDIAAAGTAGWNAGAGFAPIFLSNLGSFDGQGYTINGLVIDRPGEDNVGLFGINAGWIANLGLLGGSVTGRNLVGALAGVNGGVIDVGYSTADVNGTSAVGGLVGANAGTVVNAYASGEVQGASVAGGLVGYNAGDVLASHALGAVTSGSFAGGLVGVNDMAGLIDQSRATGAVSATQDMAGGLVGQNLGAIARTHATGAVTGAADVGGLVGQNQGTITGSYATGAATGDSAVGGLAGRNQGSVSGSYASGNAQASLHTAGGLVGHHAGAITDSYATGEATSTGTNVGGLAGYAADGSSVTNSYASGAVSGAGAVGGLVGAFQSAAATVTDSFWNSDTSGPAAAPDGMERTTEQLQSLATFSAWDISATGGTGNVWRIYEGGTAPLLRGFLTPLTVTPAYDGSAAPLANAGAYSVPNGTDSSRIFGTGQLLLSSSGASDNYLAGITGLYSSQAGYDILPAGRTIATPGSAAGDVRLDNPITWTNGTVNITAANDVDLNGQALSSANGALNFDAGNQIRNAGSVAVNLFDLQDGTWDQVAATLPSFSATDFRLSGGTFIRALGGDGDVATPYQLTDIYGLQGVNGAGMEDKNYVLANDIAAAGTANWNAGAGFAPIYLSNFGTFDGQGNTIDGLVINRPDEIGVGLFAANGGTVRNVGLVGGSVAGLDVVGALVGYNFGTISDAYSNATVVGENGVGGLVGINLAAISNSHATGDVTATGEVAGGLVGFNGPGATIATSHASGSVQAEMAVGGLVGDNSGTISRSYAAGGTVSGDFDVGGLVGYHCNCGSISESYAVADVHGAGENAGGLVGYSEGAISDSYATGTVAGNQYVGGLVGYADTGASISNSYSGASSVTGSADVGGLVGFRFDPGSTPVDNSFWTLNAGVPSTSDGGTGLTSAQMTQLASFTGAGWDISATGGTGNIWRIYEGNTAPLLRSFLTPLTVMPAYDGSGTPLANATDHTVPGGTDTSRIFGGASQLLLSSSGASGNYLASLPGLYSNQSGYDIVATRTIATPGSAAGDVRLDNPVTWTNGTVSVTAANNVDLNGQGLSSANGTLTFNAGNQVQNAGSVAVNLFDLQGGTWNQVAGTLPSFSATDFRISGGTFTRALGGDGTSTTPYRLGDVYGLQGMGSAAMGDKHYVLAGDVDATGTATWNAGAGFAPVALFTGSFDGLGHTIAGLTINRPSQGDYVGLFGQAWGPLSNVGLVGGSVVGGLQYTGGLAGMSLGTVSNAYNTGTVSAGGAYVGGLVGYVASGSVVTGSHATGAVDGGPSGRFVGGLAGANEGAISDSHASGAVSGGMAVGGLVGHNHEGMSPGSGTIANSYATGAVTGRRLVGGLAGMSDGTVSGSHATGDVTASGGGPGQAGACPSLSAETCAGGLVGFSGGSISNSYATGDVSASGNYVGGLVGRASPGAAGAGIAGSHATGAVSSSGRGVGGLVGFSDQSISGSYHTTGLVSGAHQVGGLVGEGWASISDSYATGEVVASGEQAGGLVGYLSGAFGSIRRSFADVTVTGNSEVGGLVGFAQGASIQDSYATGAVNGGSVVGGLVGRAWAGSNVTRTYATGAVSGTGGNVGGLVGWVDGPSVTDSYWDIQTTGQIGSAGGDARTTAQMRQLSIFTGWDISATGGTANTWRIYEGNTTPLLRGFLAPLTVTPAYDGSGTPLANAGAYSLPGGTDASRIFGAIPDTLSLSSSGTAGNYLASLQDGLYSNQFGYDILPATRTIATPGSAVGDVRLDNPITWTTGTVNVTAANNIDLNNQAVSGVSSTLNFNAGNRILNAGAVTTDRFTLLGGTWDQVAGTLPSFNVIDFRISGGTFIRALGGDGSLGAPYQLTDVYGLQGVGSAAMGNRHYVLANDIAAAGTSTWNAGAGFAPVADFDGSLDGQGNAIVGLVINRPTATRVGLFSNLDGSVSNLEIDGGSVRGNFDVGALAGRSNGTISNVSSSASVSGSSTVGGLVGEAAAGTISDSHATGTVDASFGAGGLVGINRASITDSDASGVVTAADVAGGLVGFNGPGATITGSHATGAVSATANTAGGLVGGNSGAIEDSYATGNVQAVFAAGGLVGDLFLGSITGSYASGTVQGQEGVGGLVGLLEGTVSDSYATGAVTGTGNYVGGLGGYAADAGSVTNSYASGAVSGVNFVGGLIGGRQSAAATVSNSFWDVQTSGQSTSDGGTGRTTAQMQAQSTFAGWDFSGTWVQYEGHTSPLLRSFMTPLTVTANNATKTYDGQAYDGAAGVSYSTAPDMTRLFGAPSYASGVNAGTHAITPGGLYSHQQGYLIAFANGTLTVDQRQLTVTGLTANDKVYDRSDAAAFSGGTLNGLVAGETLGFLAGGTFDSPNAGTGKPVTVTAVNLSNGSGLAGNYTVTLPTGLSASIAARPVNVTVSGVDKTYDGNASAALGYSDNPLPGDTITYSAAFAEFDNKNVGIGKTITVGGLASLNPNYVVVDPIQTTTADITPKDLNVTAFANNKTYNGNDNATGFFNDDRIAGDSLGYAGTFRFDNKNAGTGKLVTLSNFAVGGADAGNYRLVATPANPTANILQRNITVVVGGLDREYNGTADADVFVAGNIGLVPNDDLTVTPGAASFADKNAGVDKQVTVSSLTLGGADAGNYTVTPASYLSMATIYPRRLLVGAAIANKTYDRTMTATVTSLSDDRISGDVFDVTVTGASFDSPNAGVGRSVTVTGHAATGTDAANYWLAPAPSSANIDPRPLNLVVTGQNKVYDRSDRATVSYSDDRLGPDQIGFASTARFDNWNAGTGKPIAVTDLVITGPQAGNYSLASTSASTSADITPAPLHVTAFGGNKTYDGSTAATVHFQDDRIPNDVLTVASDPVAFADRHAGNGKALAVTGIRLSGPDAGNYSVDSTTATTTGDILPRGLFVFATGIDKVYDGTTAADVNFFDNRVAGDVFDVTGSANFADRNAGTDKLVSVSGLALSGVHAGNYITPTVPVSARADITPRPLNVGAAGVDKVYDRTTAATVNYTDDRVAGDVLNVAGTANFADMNVGTGKVVNVTGIAASGADAGNYALASTTAATTATITPAELLVRVNDMARLADGIAFSGGTGLGYTGLVAGDDASVLAGDPAWGGSAQGAFLPGRYTLSVSGLSAANYRITYADGLVTLVPAQDPLPGGQIARQAQESLQPPPLPVSAQELPKGSRVPLTIATDFLRVED